MKAQFLVLAAALVVFSFPGTALANKAHGMIEKMPDKDRNTTFTAFLKKKRRGLWLSNKKLLSRLR